MNCSILCEDKRFLSALSAANLTKGPHSEAEDHIGNAARCFSKFGDVTETKEMITALINGQRHASITESVRSAYRSGTKFEFGKHFNLINGSTFSCAGLLCAMSEAFSVDIYAVCGLLPLKFVRDGSSAIVKFRDHLQINPSKMVIGLVGLNVFHEIEQPEPELLNWDFLERNSVKMNELMLDFRIDANNVPHEDNEANVEDDYQNDDDEDDEDEDEMNNEPVDVTIPAVPANFDSVTIQDFVSNHLAVDENGVLSVQTEAYDSNSRIDVKSSSEKDFEFNPMSRFEGIVDIDGIFCYQDWRNTDAFLGNVRIFDSPVLRLKRELKTFTKVLQDSGRVDVEIANILLCKVGICETNFGTVDMFFGGIVEGDELTEEEKSIIVSESHSYGLIAKCRDAITGAVMHFGCCGFSHRENVDTFRSSRKKKARLDVYDNDRYGCFKFHFEKRLDALLTARQVPLISSYSYFQCVGTKFTLFSNGNINSLYSCIQKIDEVFDMDKMTACFYDVCYSTVAYTRDENIKVCLFWNDASKEVFRRDFGPGYSYPQLFAESLSNYHGNCTFGYIYKKNFYSSTVDILETDTNQRPVKFLNITKRALKIIASADTNALGPELSNLMAELKKEVVRLKRTLADSVVRNSSVRAELRVSHSRFASLAVGLGEYFSPGKIPNFVTPLRTSTITKLGCFYSDLLTEPIFRSIFDLITGLEDFKINNLLANLATISAFENLFVYTLFGGTTHCYIRELVWATGNDDRKSFNIMKSIKTLNRPLFAADCWNLHRLRMDSDQLPLYYKMLERFNSSMSDLRALKLCLLMKNVEISSRDKACSLWNAYFQEHPISDFISSTCIKWKKSSLAIQSGVTCSMYPISLEEAVGKAFNRQKLVHDGWKRPYLRAFDLWCSLKIDKDPFGELIKSGEILGVEIIRAHSSNTAFYARGRTYQTLSTVEFTTLSADPNVQHGVNLVNRQLSIDNGTGNRHGRGVIFSISENIDLIRGVNFIGKGRWADICKCPGLIFLKDGHRDNISLKDRFRNLEKKLLKQGVYVYIEGFRSDCLRPIPKNVAGFDFVRKSIVYEIPEREIQAPLPRNADEDENLYLNEFDTADPTLDEPLEQQSDDNVSLPDYISMLTSNSNSREVVRASVTASPVVVASITAPSVVENPQSAQIDNVENTPVFQIEPVDNSISDVSAPVVNIQLYSVPSVAVQPATFTPVITTSNDIQRNGDNSRRPQVIGIINEYFQGSLAHKVLERLLKIPSNDSQLRFSDIREKFTKNVRLDPNSRVLLLRLIEFEYLIKGSDNKICRNF